MKIRNLLDRVVASVLLVSMLASCSFSYSGPGEPERKAMESESSRLINASLDEVRSILIENGEYTEEDFAFFGHLDGEVVTRALREEDGGEDYIAFLYMVERFEDVDEVLRYSSSLLGEEEQRLLEEKARELETELVEEGERIARALNPSQREEFYNDLRSLVVKSVVLLTAAVVYAFVPKVMFWGKVSAATAVSVAAGVVASTLITIVEWSDMDMNNAENTFADWLENVTVEPFADWALAQGVLNTEMAISESPVTAALVLGVFAIYSITTNCKDILAKYNFRV